MKNKILLSGVCAAALVLTACGGNDATSVPETQTFTPATPTPANNVPTVTSSNAHQNAQVGVAFSYDATRAGTVFTDADGDALSYTVTYSPNAQGLTDNNGIISGTLSQDGTIRVTITADDGNGGTVSDTFNIAIAPATVTPTPNNAPIVASVNSNQNAQVGVAFSYDATRAGTVFTDADGDALSYTVTYSPDAQGLTDNNGIISGSVSQDGIISVTITANDGNGGTVSDTFNITVSPSTVTPTPNSAPTVASVNANQSAQVGVAFSYDATRAGTVFTDADGDALSYTVTYSPDAQGLTDNNGIISGSVSQDGIISVTITANDGNGGTVSDTFNITVSPAVVPTSNKPNIIFILSDDQGKDSSAEYSLTSDIPSTPILSALANSGVIFENAWVAPTCSPTRAALLTGKHASRTSVLQPGDDLSSTETVLHSYLKTNADTSEYASAIIGKWHLGGGVTGPNDFGVDYFAGIDSGSISDYFSWNLNINGTTTTSTNYATTELTDLAIDWVDTQTAPWFLWLSYNAPHTPYHLPPTDLHTRSLTGTTADISANSRDYYLAAIEAMDTEFGRLWNGLDVEEQANTIVIYLGDNGTPGGAVTTTAAQSGRKGGLLQGGINTPLFVSGAGITRSGEREDALVSHTDIFATVAELAGATLPSHNDGFSFADLLTGQNTTERDSVFTESSAGWAIRNEQYKLIQDANGDQTLYDLLADPAELSDLIAGGTDVSAIVSDLETEANNLRGVENITGVKFSDLSPLCSDYVGQYSSTATDVLRGGDYQGSLSATADGNTCTLFSNSIPNHDFNDGEASFVNAVAAVEKTYSISTAPTLAATTTPIDGIDNAVLLNGVKIDLLSAGCFGVGDERSGCNDPDAAWRYDPMHPENDQHQVDLSNAHAQPNGAYHYHGPPPVTNGDANTASGVIGYAADGFPIFGRYFSDNGVIRMAASSFRLKTGSRPTGTDDPGGTYDGTFVADYEYVEGHGDLDACNGMTVDGVYRYHVTDAYPYVMSCFSGTPDPSFVR